METEMQVRCSKRARKPNLRYEGSGFIRRIKQEYSTVEVDEIQVKLEDECDLSNCLSISSLDVVENNHKHDIKNIIEEEDEPPRNLLQDLGFPGESTSGIKVLPGMRDIKKECDMKTEPSDDSSINYDIKCDCEDLIKDLVPKELDLDSDQWEAQDDRSLSEGYDELDFMMGDIKNNLNNVKYYESYFGSTEEKLEGGDNIGRLHCESSTNHSSKTVDQSELSEFSVLADHKLKGDIDTIVHNVENFQCHSCGKLFGLKKYFRLHIEGVHLNLQKFQRNWCDNCFSTKYSQKYHNIKSVHRNRNKLASHFKNYRCPRSGTRHIENVHIKMRKFKCHLCDCRFMRRCHLSVHINRIHLKLKKFACNSCEYRCATKDQLKRHTKRIHLKTQELNSKKLKCHLCDSGFTRKQFLSDHIDAVHLKLKKFACQLCEHRCAAKGDLKKHINRIHVKIKKFKCHLCESPFSEKYHLSRHIDRVHLKIKKFACDLCEYRCAAKHELTKHIDKVHFKIKKFSCEMCEYCCAAKDELLRHITYLHIL